MTEAEQAAADAAARAQAVADRLNSVPRRTEAQIIAETLGADRDRWRQEAEAAAAAHAADKARLAEALAKLDALPTTIEAERNAVRREARLLDAAREAGMHDASMILAMPGTDKVEFKDGALVGIAEHITALKEAKPFLFAAPAGAVSGSTTAGARAPTPKAGAQDANSMTHEEWRAGRARITAVA